MPTQVDAHVLLAKSGDARLIAEWASLGSEYAMLTTYTMPYDDIDKVDQIPHICKCVRTQMRKRQRILCAAANRGLPFPGRPQSAVHSRLHAVRCRVWFEVSSPADVEVRVTAGRTAPPGLPERREVGVLAYAHASVLPSCDSH